MKLYDVVRNYVLGWLDDPEERRISEQFAREEQPIGRVRIQPVSIEIIRAFQSVARRAVE